MPPQIDKNINAHMEHILSHKCVFALAAVLAQPHNPNLGVIACSDSSTYLNTIEESKFVIAILPNSSSLVKAFLFFSCD